MEEIKSERLEGTKLESLQSSIRWRARQLTVTAKAIGIEPLRNAEAGRNYADDLKRESITMAWRLPWLVPRCATRHSTVPACLNDECLSGQRREKFIITSFWDDLNAKISTLGLLSCLPNGSPCRQFRARPASKFRVKLRVSDVITSSREPIPNSLVRKSVNCHCEQMAF